MNAQFQAYIDQLPTLLDRLTRAPALHRDDLDGIPMQGVYVFYEGTRAISAGRSDNLYPYLMSQGRPGSDHYTAPIAYGFAKKAAIAAGYRFTRAADAIRDPRFIPYFAREKARVADMRIRVVEVTDPILQSLMVMYASLELRTLNGFETH